MIIKRLLKVLLALVLCFSIVEYRPVYANDGIETQALSSSGEIVIELSNRFKEALLSGETRVNVSDLELNKATYSWIADSRMFPYFNGSIYANLYSNGDVAREYMISTTLSQSEIVKHVKLVDEIVAEVAEKVSVAKNDVQVALIVHDYLASQFAYDEENYINNYIPDSSYTTGGMLSTGLGVCQAYAFAYQYFMLMYDIDCYVTTSRAMNHAWNIIKLNNKYYHVDVTWDDPVSDSLGYARHNHFLLSDSAIKTIRGNGTKNHHSWDRTDLVCNDTTYDNYWWYGVNSPIEVYGNYYYYMDSANYRVAKRHYTSGSVTTVASTGKWPASSGGNWVGVFGSLFIENGCLYYNTATNIYMYNLSNNKNSSILSMNTSNGYFYGLQFKMGKLNYEVRKNATDDGKLYTASMQISQNTVVVNSVSIYPTTTLDMIVGQSKALTGYIEPANASNRSLTWSSSNTSVATVKYDGTVSAVGAGTAVITVKTHNGKTATCTVTVSDKQVSAIVITSPINKSTYIKDVDALDVSGGKFKVVYNDGTVIQNIDLSEATITGFDNSVVGKQTLTVEYMGVTCSLVVNVVEKKVASIEIYEMPKTTYIEGQKFDPSNGKLKVNYNDGGYIIIGMSEANLPTLQYLAPGTYTATVSYGGHGAKLDITILAKTVTGLEVNLSKTTYYIGESLPSYTTVRVYYDNDTWDSLYISEVTVSGFDTTTIGTKTATFTYGGVSQSVSYEVKAVTVTNITVSNTPKKTSYLVGEALDVTGGNIRVYYSDGSNKTVSMTKDMVKNYDPNVVGKQRLTVEYEGYQAQFSVTVSEEVVVSDDVYRIYGSNRYETAFKTADTLKETLGVDKFDTVIIANGTNFADALAGSYLAAKKSAPILMTDKKDTNIQTLQKYIKANVKAGGTVYILGGYAALPESIDKGLTGYTVKRLAGNDRYATNLKILEEAGVSNEIIVVCTGKNFADSLSASASGMPILLVDKSLTSSQKEFLSGLNGNLIAIVGGPAAVNTSIQNALGKYGQVVRVAGNNRYQTSVLVAYSFFEHPNSAVLALATNFPDGLSGGPLAYAIGSPLLLTNGSPSNYYITSDYSNTFGITSGYVLGGSGLVTDRAVRTIFGLSNDKQIKIK